MHLTICVFTFSVCSLHLEMQVTTKCLLVSNAKYGLSLWTLKLDILKIATEKGDPVLQESCLSICQFVRWSVAKAVVQRAGSWVTWCSLFVLSCALLPLSGDSCSCLDVRFLARLRCHQDKEPVHPQATIMLLFKLAAVLPKESPIDGPSPETEPIQFKAQCDAFEMWLLKCHPFIPVELEDTQVNFLAF